MADNNKKALELIKKAAALLESGADSGVTMPASEDVAGLDKAQIAAIAEAYSISTEGKKASEVKTLVTLAAQIVEGAETDDLDEDGVTELCEAVGVAPKKKLAATVEDLKSYFDSVQDTEDGEASEDSEEDESEESEDEEASEDEDESEESDEDEKPAKGKKKAKDEDDNGDDAESDESDEDSEDEAEESEDEEESEDGEEAEEEEVSDKDKKKRVDAYNKVAKVKVKNYEALKKLLVDNEGNTAEWGVPYVKGDGDEAEAYCCGLKLKTIPHPNKKKAKAGEEAGQCKVTNKVFEQADDGSLQEVED
jgi:hypothetical protein